MNGADRPRTETLAAILLMALQQLAAEGRVDEACRMAGRACAVLRQSDLMEWRKFNAFLHRVVRDAPDVGRGLPVGPYGSSSVSQ